MTLRKQCKRKGFARPAAAAGHLNTRALWLLQASAGSCSLSSSSTSPASRSAPSFRCAGARGITMGCSATPDGHCRMPPAHAYAFLCAARPYTLFNPCFSACLQERCTWHDSAWTHGVIAYFGSTVRGLAAVHDAHCQGSDAKKTLLVRAENEAACRAHLSVKY